MTKRRVPDRDVMLNLGLMKIRLVSASGFFLPPGDSPFIPVPVYRPRSRPRAGSGNHREERGFATDSYVLKEDSGKKRKILP